MHTISIHIYNYVCILVNFLRCTYSKSQKQNVLYNKWSIDIALVSECKYITIHAHAYMHTWLFAWVVFYQDSNTPHNR